MSRIGKLPVKIPENVEVMIEENIVQIKGPKGQLQLKIHPKIKLVKEEGQINVKKSEDTKQVRSLHGLTRMLLNNAVLGVTEGFEKKLKINGVGYKASSSGKELSLDLGFSHQIKLKIPEEINVGLDKEDKSIIIISGINKELVGKFTAEIRELKPPEPYKGKGIRHIDENVKRKVGKSVVKQEI